MARSTRAALPAALALLTLVALVPLWIPGPLPLQDLPNHLLKVDVLRHWIAGDPQAREVFDLNLRPVPNLTCYLVLLALSPLMDLMTAARLYLSACVLALCWAAWVLVRRVNADDAAVALVAPGLVYTDFLSKGFLNFVLALPLYVMALTLTIALLAPSRRYLTDVVIAAVIAAAVVASYARLGSTDVTAGESMWQYVKSTFEP